MPYYLVKEKTTRTSGFYLSLLLQGLLISSCASMAGTIIWGLLFYQPSFSKLGGRLGLGALLLCTGLWHLCFLLGAALVFFNVKRMVRRSPLLRTITFLLLPAALLALLLLDSPTLQAFCFPQAALCFSIAQTVFMLWFQRRIH